MLALEGVSREFANGAGVRDVSLTVPAGQIVALIGLNGAGKTTLMRLALGMLRPRAGGVHLVGEPLPGLPAARWREVGALIEVPLAYPELTARENVRIVSLLRGLPANRIDSVLHYWGLDRSEEHTSELQSRGHLVCRLLLEKKKYFLIFR